MSAWGLGNIGSGVGSVYGMIVVDYPSGSTLVLKYRASSSGTYANYNAKRDDLSTTRALYYVKDAGQYQVTSTKGSSSASKAATLNVTSRSAYLTITYTSYTYLYLVQNATRTSAFTLAGKWMTEGARTAGAIAMSPTASYTAGSLYQIEAQGEGASWTQGIAYYPTKINLATYDLLHIDGKIKNATGTDSYLGVNAWTAIGANYQTENRLFQTALTTTASSYTSFSKDISISSYTSSCYIGINVTRRNNANSGIQVVNMYLRGTVTG